jgi:hypothetical protein
MILTIASYLRPAMSLSPQVCCVSIDRDTLSELGSGEEMWRRHIEITPELLALEFSTELPSWHVVDRPFLDATRDATHIRNFSDENLQAALLDCDPLRIEPLPTQPPRLILSSDGARFEAQLDKDPAYLSSGTLSWGLIRELYHRILPSA